LCIALKRIARKWTKQRRLSRQAAYRILWGAEGGLTGKRSLF